jgi:ribonuclease HI
VNVDVAVSKVGDKGVGAAFCRDHSGLYMGASPVVYTGITDPAVLEALACREALALALDLGISHLLVASDCKTVVNDISDGSMGRYEIKAHDLARFVLSLDSSGRYLWLGAPYAPHIPINIIIVADQ